MAATTDDEQGAAHPDLAARGADSGGHTAEAATGHELDTALQGDDMGDDAGRTVDETTADDETTDRTTSARPSAASTPRPPRSKNDAARRPAATRTAADRSAAAKKAAATRAANARARAAAAAAEAAATAAAARAAEEEAAARAVAEEAAAQSPAPEIPDDVALAIEPDDATSTDGSSTGDGEAEAAADEASSGELDDAMDDEVDGSTDDADEQPAGPAADADSVDEPTDASEGTPAVAETGTATVSDAAATTDDEVVVSETARASSESDEPPVVLSISGLVKRYGATTAVDGIDLEVRAGSFYGIVGPNGAGKTTTLSIVTGLLRPDEGSVSVLGSDVWSDPAAAKRALGVLPDRLRLFDRLTGAQLLYYSATLRGLDGATARKRSSDLATAFGLHDALGRLVSDYSVGMTKKIALAAAIIHSPRVLVLDEPFESVDPVSAQTVTDVLQRYVAGGGTVLLSSHSMDLVERICDSVAVIVDGHVLASGTVDEVRAGRSLEQTFVELAGGRAVTEGMEWLQSFSD